MNSITGSPFEPPNLPEHDDSPNTPDSDREQGVYGAELISPPGQTSGTGSQGEPRTRIEPQAAASPPHSTAATILCVLRWTAVVIGTAVVLTVTISGWTYLQKTIVNPPGTDFLNSAENEAARERLPELRAKLAQQIAEQQELRRLGTYVAPEPTPVPPPESHETQAHGEVPETPDGLTSEDVNELLPAIALIAENEDAAASLTPLAHHPNRRVRDIVHPLLDEKTLWDEAIMALKTDYDRAASAAAWIADQPPVDDRREAVRTALRSRLWLNDESRFPALAAYACWAESDDFDPLLPMLDNETVEASAVAQLCRGLVRTSHPKLNETLANQSKDRRRIEYIRTAMRDDAVLTHAIIAYLAEADLSLLLQPWVEAMQEHAGPEDLPALKAYGQRIASDYRFNRQYGIINSTIRRLSESSDQ